MRYPFIPANTPLGHCPSPLEQWPPQLANRDHPSSRSAVTQRISPPPAAQPFRETCSWVDARPPRRHRRPLRLHRRRPDGEYAVPRASSRHTAAHCTHTGCPRCAHTAAHCTHTGCQSTAVTESCAQIAGFPTARQPYARLARASSASKNPLYLGPTRRRSESSRIGDRGADFSVEVPSLVNHESALPQ